MYLVGLQIGILHNNTRYVQYRTQNFIFIFCSLHCIVLCIPSLIRPIVHPYIYFKLVDGVEGCTCRFTDQQALIWRGTQSSQPHHISLWLPILCCRQKAHCSQELRVATFSLVNYIVTPLSVSSWCKISVPSTPLSILQGTTWISSLILQVEIFENHDILTCRLSAKDKISPKTTYYSWSW